MHYCICQGKNRQLSVVEFVAFLFTIAKKYVWRECSIYLSKRCGFTCSERIKRKL